METQNAISQEEISNQRAIEREYEEYDIMKPSLNCFESYDDFDIMGSYL